MEKSDPNRGAQIQIVTAVFLGLAWISVVMRCYVRHHILKSFSIDDWLIAIGLIVFTLYSSFLLVAVHYGLGQHNASLPMNIWIKGMEYTNVSTMIYILNMAIVKSSIAISLLRLAIVPVYRWILQISMLIVILWSLVTFLFDIFTCNPVEYQWDTTIQGKCVSDDSIEAAALSFSIMGIISDWLYALIPIPIIWNVKLSIQAKVSVSAILSLGIFASVATLVRLKYLTDIADQTDFLYQAIDAGIWTNIEIGLSIVAASIVTLRPLLRALKVRGFSNDDTATTTLNTGPPGRPYGGSGSGGGGTWASRQRSQRTQNTSRSNQDHGFEDGHGQGESQVELNGMKVHTMLEQTDTRSQRATTTTTTTSQEERERDNGSQELIFQGPRMDGG